MKKIVKDYLGKFELTLFSVILALTFIGFIAIYSATRTSPNEQGFFFKQLTTWVLSLVFMVGMIYIPTQHLKTITIPFYVISLLLLIGVLIFGKVVGGQRCWIHIGGFSFQPSEVAKISAVLALAQFLTRQQTNIESLKDICIALFIGLFPVLLIMMEPDLGSSFIFFAIILLMLFWNGISMFGLFFVLSPGAAAIASLFGTYYFMGALVVIIGVLIFFGKDIFLSGSIVAINLAAGFFVDYVYKILSPHQQKRILSFVDPNSDPLGAGYNSLQAKIAIGAGGFFGQGYLSGHQTQLHYIPEQWTDFIFCTIGEEFGLLGSLVVIVLFGVVFLRLIRIATSERDKYLSLVVIGTLAIFVTHFLINVGMAIGLMPVVGVPLPFISYGGTSLLCNMSLLGIVLNIYKNRIER